jgi:hypothetical protein
MPRGLKVCLCTVLCISAGQCTRRQTGVHGDSGDVETEVRAVLAMTSRGSLPDGFQAPDAELAARLKSLGADAVPVLVRVAEGDPRSYRKILAFLQKFDDEHAKKALTGWLRQRRNTPFGDGTHVPAGSQSSRWWIVDTCATIRACARFAQDDMVKQDLIHLLLEEWPPSYDGEPTWLVREAAADVLARGGGRGVEDALEVVARRQNDRAAVAAMKALLRLRGTAEYGPVLAELLETAPPFHARSILGAMGSADPVFFEVPLAQFIQARAALPEYQPVIVEVADPLQKRIAALKRTRIERGNPVPPSSSP